MQRTRYLKAALSGAAVLLALPAVAFAQEGPTLDDTVSSLNTTWVIVAAVLVMFMQAGFALLEIGFSRMKNAGAGRREDPDQLLDRLALLLGGRVRARLRRRGDDRR